MLGFRPFSISEHAGYRFGFNGMEKDDEVKGNGNSLDFGARIYDPRIGKWLAMDPLQASYAGFSPYNFVLNRPIQFIDPDGRVVVDPKTGEQVVKVDGQWKTVSGGDVSADFVKNTQPVLDKLTASDVGTKIYDELQGIRTKVVIDLSDKKNLRTLEERGSNSIIRPPNGDFKANSEDGLYDEVIITPNLEKIEAGAKKDGIDYEEKLIQTMSIEKDHIDSKDQIAKEASYNYNLFQSPDVVEDAYGPLLQGAVQAGKEYRQEKGQEIDESSNLPIKRVNEATGSNIQTP